MLKQNLKQNLKHTNMLLVKQAQCTWDLNFSWNMNILINVSDKREGDMTEFCNMGWDCYWSDQW